MLGDANRVGTENNHTAMASTSSKVVMTGPRDDTDEEGELTKHHATSVQHVLIQHLLQGGKLVKFNVAGLQCLAKICAQENSIL